MPLLLPRILLLLLPLLLLPTRAVNANEILAQAGGLTLTTAHVDVGVALAAFIIDKPLKTSEINALRRQSVFEFQQQPDYFLQGIQQIEQSLQQVRTLTDPWQIGLARQVLFSNFYLATAALAETQKPLLIQVINRYVKVLATDPANQLVLTVRDADAVAQYIAFMARLSGQMMVLTPSVKNQYRTELAGNFSALTLEQKQFLSSASLIWKLVEYNWRQLSAHQRTELQQQLLSANTPARPANAPVNSPSAAAVPETNKRLQIMQKQQDLWHQQQMWDMMNTMSLQNHATTLNIIENIGGTGDYWEITDDPW